MEGNLYKPSKKNKMKDVIYILKSFLINFFQPMGKKIVIFI